MNVPPFSTGELASVFAGILVAIVAVALVPLVVLYWIGSVLFSRP